MNRICYVAKVVLVGLCATQVLATVHVLLSNTALYRTVSAAKAAGYVTIPNAIVAPTLKQFGPAFLGGCFFTLSLGAGLCLFCVAVAWAWDRLANRNRTCLMLVLGLWLALVAMINSQGFSMMVSAYFFVVPAVVFMAALKWIPPKKDKTTWPASLIPVVPIVLLTILWSAQADRFLFLDIRDFLLLSNPVGQQVDRFYYRYTLYPAQVFKTLEQKTLKTCHVVSHAKEGHATRIEDILAENDYLLVNARDPVDLEVTESAGSGLQLKREGAVVIQTTVKAFFSQPKTILHRFSVKTDGYDLFRKATMIGLLIGFPVLLYLVVFALIHFVCGFFVTPVQSLAITGGLCLLVGLALLAPLRSSRAGALSPGQVSRALNASSWPIRVSALRTVVDKKLEIGRFPAYRRILTSPHVPERYWLAKALGSSREPGTLPALMTLLDDPYPDVVSMAFYALGRRGEKRVAAQILKRMETSDHWYNQWYAYRALRALGWHQTGGTGNHPLGPLP